MNPKLKSLSTDSGTFVGAIVFCLLFLNVAAVAQLPKPKNETGGLYAGIELSPEAATAIALSFSDGDEEPGLKLVYSEVIKLSLGRTSGGDFAPQAVGEAVQAVQKLLTRLRETHRVPDQRISLIGSHGLSADPPKGLAEAVGKVSRKELVFLDAATDVQLGIVGTIPRREKVGEVWIDNRNTSALIEIGSHGTRGGYQLLRRLLNSPPAYEFVTMNIPHGVVSYANDLSKLTGNGGLQEFAQLTKTNAAAPFRKALRASVETRMGLMTRNRLYLSGEIVRAMIALLYPTERKNFVSITSEDIKTFAARAAQTPQSLLKPNLSQISNRELRQEAERELEAVKNAFTPQQLIAGAEMLKAVAEELNLPERKIWFVRFGQYGRLLSYVRLQAGR